jgi:hypothetical protein
LAETVAQCSERATVDCPVLDILDGGSPDRNSVGKAGPSSSKPPDGPRTDDPSQHVDGAP